MKIFSKIREFFWPLLEKEDIPEPVSISPEDINVNENHFEKTLEYAIKDYESEEERRKLIESKSSLFIGTISVVTTVMIGVTSILVKINDFNHSISILVFLLFLITIYMARTVWFSVKVLERSKYFAISIDDFLIKDEGVDYYKKLISEITNKIRKNSVTINSKVDNMTMAQEYFKRAIIVVVVYSFAILIFCISASTFNLSYYLLKCVDLLNRINLIGLNTIVIYTLLIFSLALSIRANIRKKK
jgi:hypothetical protein